MAELLFIFFLIFLGFNFLILLSFYSVVTKCREFAKRLQAAEEGIEERKRSEEETRTALLGMNIHVRPEELKDHYPRVIQNLVDTPVGISEINDLGVIQWSRGGALESSSISEKTRVGKKIHEPVLANFQTVLDGGSLLYTSREDDGEKYSVYYTPRYDSKGAINGSVAWWFWFPRSKNMLRLYSKGSKLQ